jgi:hypothetical protein
MRIFFFLLTILMLAGSGFTLGLLPRALRDLGQERQTLTEALPGVEFDQMVEAGYRVNTILLLAEIFYYYLLLRYAGPEWQFYYGGFTFGVIHIFYLIEGRIERRRLKKGKTNTSFARALIWLTGILTVIEAAFLIWVAYLLLQPEPF